jgi:hypothetical protein
VIDLGSLYEIKTLTSTYDDVSNLSIFEKQTELHVFFNNIDYDTDKPLMHSVISKSTFELVRNESIKVIDKKLISPESTSRLKVIDIQQHEEKFLVFYGVEVQTGNLKVSELGLLGYYALAEISTLDNLVSINRLTVAGTTTRLAADSEPYIHNGTYYMPCVSSMEEVNIAKAKKNFDSEQPVKLEKIFVEAAQFFITFNTETSEIEYRLLREKKSRYITEQDKFGIQKVMGILQKMELIKNTLTLSLAEIDEN